MADDDDCDFLAQTYNGMRNDEESGLQSPQTEGFDGARFEDTGRVALDLEAERADNRPISLPPGCHVEVDPDVERVRRVQGEHWEKEVMTLISGCSGTVLRHSGDLTLVQFLVEDVKISTSIFRTLLSVVAEEDELEQTTGAQPSPRSATNDSEQGAEPLPGLVRRRSRKDSMINNLLMNTSIVTNYAYAELPESDRCLVELFEKGNQKFKERDFQGAIELFSQALSAAAGPGGSLSACQCEIIPVHAILSNRSGAYLAAGEWEKAFEDAMVTISLKPNSTKGYVRAGNVHRALRQYQQARKMFSTALRLDTENSEIQYLVRASHVAEVYAKLGHLQRIHVAWTRGQRVAIHSKKAVDTNDQLFVEPPLFCTGCPTASAPPNYCDFCARTLVDDGIQDAIPPELQDAFAELSKRSCVAPEPVPCASHCGAMYCSERCRERACLSFHSLECKASHHKWSSLLQQLYVREGSSLSFTEKSLLKLAVRIVATAIARVRGERPSNHDGLFLELFPSSIGVKPSSGAGPTPLQSVAESFYTKHLAPQLSTYERGMVTLEQWKRIVEIVTANGIFSTCSPWNELRITAQEFAIETPKTMLALDGFLRSEEALSCTSQAVSLFPTMPHFQRAQQGNLKIYVSGCWKPTVVGVTTKPILAGEALTAVDTPEPYEGDARNVCLGPSPGNSPARGAVRCDPGSGNRGIAKQPFMLE
jgi:tetratricopeptide (TPR) repeat protein